MLCVAFEFYSALRQLGLDIDIVRPDAPLDHYQMVAVPCMPVLPDGLVKKLAGFNGPVLLGARTGSKTATFSIPDTLPPGELQDLMPIKVTRAESLREGIAETGAGFAITGWLEHVESSVEPEIALSDGRGIAWRNGRFRYLAGWPDAALLNRVLVQMAEEAGLPIMQLPHGLRTRRAGSLLFAFNYGGKSYRSVQALLADCCTQDLREGEVVRSQYGVTAPGVIAAKETNLVFQFARTGNAIAVWDRFEALRIKGAFSARGCYCSVFDTCWTTDFKSADRMPVKSCPAPKVQFQGVDALHPSPATDR